MDERRDGWSRWWGVAWLAAGWMSGFGCMSLNLGNRTYETPGSYVDHGGVLRQSGETPLVRTQDDRIEVYYPRPYANKPNLTLGKQPNSVPAREIELVEQTSDHFTVRWKGAGGEANLSWHAEGIPGPVAVETNPPVANTAAIKPATPGGGS